MKSFLLTHPLLLASIKGCYQPKTKSFDDLTNKPPREKKKGKKEKERKRENQRKTKEKPREKEKEKREKGRGKPRQQGEKKEEVHGSKEKEGEVTPSHHEPPWAAVAAADVGKTR